MKEIIYYQTIEGKCPYIDWYNSLDMQVKIRVIARLDRLKSGHYGETRKLAKSELSELKFKFGKGYRIYYKDLDDCLIIFLSAGDKSGQKSDIKKAENFYQDYLERLNSNE